MGPCLLCSDVDCTAATHLMMRRTCRDGIMLVAGSEDPQAMDLLWPDLGLRAASNNLRPAFHVARRTLHPDPAIASRYLNLSGVSSGRSARRNNWGWT